MILTAHQPVYLPWLGLFHKIALADTFVSFNQVQYLPKDWNNRNRIKTANGPIWLTVPVLKSGHREKNLKEIEINNDVTWRRKHWKSICLNYKKAPFFSRYESFFEDVYAREWQYLAELNDYMLKWFLDTLNIKTVFLDASDYDFQGVKNELVLDMCKHLGSDVYIFGELGADYADTESFRNENMDVLFQKYKHPVYPQLHEPFISHLSILDLLFNCGDKSFEVLMDDNLIKKDIRRVVK